LRPCSIKLSNLIVNLAIRSRSSSKPKLMLGRESAIEGASEDERGGRIVLVEREGSKGIVVVTRRLWQVGVLREVGGL
jgi:hypothetical protein